MASAAPRGTPQAPTLAQSMNIANARPKGESAAVAIAVGPSRDVFYGLMQELGTSRHGAKPFARPAFDEKTRQALLIVQSRLWAALTARGLAGSRGSGGGGVGL
jgi:hypothetical protein